MSAVLKVRVELFLILMLGVMALTAGITQPPLVDWDEATYAEVAHEAVASGHYMDFTWNAEPYFKKPPLLFWELILSFKTFGESEWAARIPSVLMGLGTLILLYLTASLFGGRLAGTFAALIPLQFYFFIARGGRECATDSSLIFFMTLALYSLLRASANRRWCMVAGAACGLAILSKGLAGTIPLIVAAGAVLTVPACGAIGLSGLLIIFLTAVLVAGPWYAFEAIANYKIFWSTFVVQETLNRVTSHLEDNPQPAIFPLLTFGREISFLWPVLLPASIALLSAWRRGSVRTAKGSTAAAPTIWVLWLLVSLCAACAVRTKLPWYILPALIPAALLAGTMLARAFTAHGPHRRYSIAGAAIAVVVILAGLPARWHMISSTFQEQRVRSSASYAMAVKARQMFAEHGGGDLFFADEPSPTLVYYSGIRCHFTQPSLPRFELTDNDADFLDLSQGDLKLVGADGQDVMVANLADEWALYGPGANPSNFADLLSRQGNR